MPGPENKDLSRLGPIKERVEIGRVDADLCGIARSGEVESGGRVRVCFFIYEGVLE
jgi:hypothetical protein